MAKLKNNSVPYSTVQKSLCKGHFKLLEYEESWKKHTMIGPFCCIHYFTSILVCENTHRLRSARIVPLSQASRLTPSLTPSTSPSPRIQFPLSPIWAPWGSLQRQSLLTHPIAEPHQGTPSVLPWSLLCLIWRCPVGFSEMCCRAMKMWVWLLCCIVFLCVLKAFPCSFFSVLRVMVVTSWGLHCGIVIQ